MESIAITILKDKLTDVNKGIIEVSNKKGDSIKTLIHIKKEIEKALLILEQYGAETTKQGFGQLIIPNVGKCARCSAKTEKITINYCDSCIQQEDYS